MKISIELSDDALLRELGDRLAGARLARAHNDANVLAMGARVIAPELALEIVGVFAATGFEGGMHVGRLEQIARYEENS